jgi:hypothetical protein
MQPHNNAYDYMTVATGGNGGPCNTASTGLAWCESTQRCIAPWREPCPPPAAHTPAGGASTPAGYLPKPASTPACLQPIPGAGGSGEAPYIPAKPHYIPGAGGSGEAPYIPAKPHYIPGAGGSGEAPYIPAKPHYIPGAGGSGEAPYIPAHWNPVLPPYIPAHWNPVLPPVIPAHSHWNPVLPPVIPAHSHWNPVLPPVIPAHSHWKPVLPPVIPAHSHWKPVLPPAIPAHSHWKPVLPPVIPAHGSTPADFVSTCSITGGACACCAGSERTVMPLGLGVTVPINERCVSCTGQSGNGAACGAGPWGQPLSASAAEPWAGVSFVSSDGVVNCGPGAPFVCTSPLDTLGAGAASRPGPLLDALGDGSAYASHGNVKVMGHVVQPGVLQAQGYSDPANATMHAYAPMHSPEDTADQPQQQQQQQQLPPPPSALPQPPSGLPQPPGVSLVGVFVTNKHSTSVSSVTLASVSGVAGSTTSIKPGKTVAMTMAPGAWHGVSTVHAVAHGAEGDGSSLVGTFGLHAAAHAPHPKESKALFTALGGAKKTPVSWTPEASSPAAGRTGKHLRMHGYVVAQRTKGGKEAYTLHVTITGHAESGAKPTA